MNKVSFGRIAIMIEGYVQEHEDVLDMEGTFDQRSTQAIIDKTTKRGDWRVQVKKNKVI